MKFFHIHSGNHHELREIHNSLLIHQVSVLVNIVYHIYLHLSIVYWINVAQTYCGDYVQYAQSPQHTLNYFKHISMIKRNRKQRNISAKIKSLYFIFFSTDSDLISLSAKASPITRHKIITEPQIYTAINYSFSHFDEYLISSRANAYPRELSNIDSMSRIS